MPVDPKGWTPARRAAAAVRIRAHKPWLKSTGPRSVAGKARCARNALKHGMRSFEGRQLLAVMAEQRAFRRAVEAWLRIRKHYRLATPPDSAPLRDWGARVFASYRLFERARPAPYPWLESNGKEL